MLRETLIRLPRWCKRLILVANDLLLVELCLLAAFYLRLGWDPLTLVATYTPVFWVVPLCVLAFLYKLELYSSITRHAGVEVIAVLARGVSFGALLVLLIFFLVPINPPLPRSVLLMFWGLSFLALMTSRLVAARWLHGTSLSTLVMEFARGTRHRRHRGRPVAIYGAGSAGRQLALALRDGVDIEPAIFVDDDPALQTHVVAGLKVYSPQDLPTLAQDREVEEVLLALPSVSRHRRQEIIRFLEPLDLKVRSVPATEELAQGLVKVEDIRDVDLADVLGRETVPPDLTLLRATISDRNVVVTGAGGSIGAELCRQILRQWPRRLVLIEHGEYALYRIHAELEEMRARLDGGPELVPVLDSVVNGDRLEGLFRKHAIDTVYHAAAYKHVPLVESNGYQGFVNNVCGTLATARAAMKAGVARMVLISSDKAVRPTNLMGATKRLTELALRALSEQSRADFSRLECLPQVGGEETVDNRTCFTMVRFGNVLDSSGSVVPKFRRQIREGGPVTVTHPDATRYFMTIPEAADLVLQASGLSEGGDLFILDMGEPVRIDDLARKLIYLSGLTLRDRDHPDGDIEIQYTGIRPGEKLHEELLVDADVKATSHPKIWRARECVMPWPQLEKLLSRLEQLLEAGDMEQVRQLLSCAEIGFATDARDPSPAVAADTCSREQARGTSPTREAASAPSVATLSGQVDR